MITGISDINMCHSKCHSRKHRYDRLTVVYLVLVVLAYHTHGLTVNLSRHGLTSLEFDNISININVQILDLSHNGILQVSWFPQYVSLREIRLNNNYLKVIPDMTNVSNSLRVLDLSRNQITHVSKQRLERLNLTELHMAENEIVSFPDMNAPWGDHIVELELSGNHLSTIPRIASLNKYAKIYMGGNPIVCNCTLRYTSWSNTEGAECQLKHEYHEYGKMNVKTVMTNPEEHPGKFTNAY